MPAASGLRGALTEVGGLSAGTASVALRMLPVSTITLGTSTG
jgi:hypothetical protein